MAKKEIFTGTPNTKGPMKPGETCQSPDKPKSEPQPQSPKPNSTEK